MQIDEIIKLIETVSKNDVDSLNYSTDSEKIVIKKNKTKFVAGEVQTVQVLPVTPLLHHLLVHSTVHHRRMLQAL